jgi:undecaprenyl-diphosphatase
LSALVAGVAAIYDSVKEGDGLAQVDRPVLDWMVAHRTPTLDTVVTAFTNIGGPTLLPIIATVVTLLLAWRWQSWTPIALMVVATAGSLAMTGAGKDLAGRVRPPQSLAVPPLESSASFPSGHTLNSTVIAIVLSYLVVLHVQSRRARSLVIVGLAVYAVLMGLSRVYLGHHWFTDVVAGWIAGAAWASALILAHRLLLVVQRRRHQEHQRRESERGAAQASTP